MQQETLTSYIAPFEQQQIERAQACLLAGAIGDALGAPVEFLSSEQIRQQFGPQGIRDYSPAYGRLGAISDDTQMMLFTAEGLIRAVVRGYPCGMVSIPGVVHHALLRWLLTQGLEPGGGSDGIRSSIDRVQGLVANKALWSRRAPSATCISSLSTSTYFGDAIENDRKGCGGVMRSAPFTFWSNAFENASDSAQLTHGHPTGYLAAGLFADILCVMPRSQATTPGHLMDIVRASLERHRHRDGMDELNASVCEVLRYVEQGKLPQPATIDAFGGGWLADEALAIGLWCALSASSLEEGIIMAVNHGGDSDSTGLIAGHFLGLMYALEAIPERWLAGLEHKELILQIGKDIIEVPQRCVEQGEDLDDEVFRRYPGV